MSSDSESSPRPKLSICIATFNRATFLRETLRSIVPQMTGECEIVVSDNASTDTTEQVVAEWRELFANLRYVKQETNRGLDRNFDCAVQRARGEYCWLFPDDDLLKPGAVARVLAELKHERKPSLVVVNMEFRNSDLSQVLRSSGMSISSDQLYEAADLDRIFLDLDAARLYIGSLVIHREVWLSREREIYYDSLCCHVATIFQKPLPGVTLAIAQPLITYRMGNELSYSADLSDAWLGKWPALVESLALSRETKRKLGSAEPWSHPGLLLLLRARDLYSLREYRLWIRPKLAKGWDRLVASAIAILPGVLVNSLFVTYYLVRGDALRLFMLRLSRFHLRRRLARWVDIPVGRA